ncbi:Ribonucleases P/MRP protein subunit pop1 [Fusarium oxysporum f. sp. albedinis]|nr:Ribonucleases P/MRP protein subunit pop1 [Fusarium oxysporum f. sp. albedinis]
MDDRTDSNRQKERKRGIGKKKRQLNFRGGECRINEENNSPRASLRHTKSNHRAPVSWFSGPTQQRQDHISQWRPPLPYPLGPLLGGCSTEKDCELSWIGLGVGLASDHHDLKAPVQKKKKEEEEVNKV